VYQVLEVLANIGAIFLPGTYDSPVTTNANKVIIKGIKAIAFNWITPSC
jgi:hypothetical protein